MAAPIQTFPEAESENHPKDCSGNVISSNENTNQIVSNEPTGGGENKGGGILNDNIKDEKIKDKANSGSCCKRSKRISPIRKLLNWLDHFEPAHPKREPRVPKLGPLSGHGGKKKGIIGQILDRLDPPTKRIYKQQKEKEGGTSNRNINQNHTSVIRLPLRNLILRNNKENSSEEINEMVSKVSVKQTTQTPITLLNEEISKDEILLSEWTYGCDSQNPNSKNEQSIQNIKKGCQHCKEKLKNMVDQFTETELSIPINNKKNSSFVKSSSVISLHDVQFNNENLEECINVPCCSHNTSYLQTCCEWPLPIIPEESLRRRYYPCIPVNSSFMTSNINNPCGLVQAMIAYWETSDCCNSCRETAAATAYHLACHQADYLRARRHCRHRLKNRCNNNRSNRMGCNYSNYCYKVNNKCNYPLKLENSNCRKSSIKKQNEKRNSKNIVKNIDTGKILPNLNNSEEYCENRQQNTSQNQILTNPSCSIEKSCSELLYCPTCSCTCAFCTPPETLLNLNSSLSSLSYGSTSSEIFSPSECCIPIQYNTCYNMGDTKMEPTPNLIKKKSSIKTNKDDLIIMEEEEEEEEEEKNIDDPIIKKNDDKIKIKWDVIIYYLLWGLVIFCLIALLYYLLPKLLRLFKGLFSGCSKSNLAKRCRIYIVGLEKEILLKYGYCWKFPNSVYRSIS